MPPKTTKPQTGRQPQSGAMTTQQSQKEDPAAKSIVYIPLGEKTEVALTLGQVQQHLAVRTRSGALPNVSDCVKYMMLCKARELNPWAGDAYLIGYDGRDGPVFSCITAHQSLLKRAEHNKNFDGMESGVIVASDNGKGDIDYRDGDFVIPGEKLLGGWAKVYRSDQDHPSYDALNVEPYHQGNKQWNKDAAGMIVKCAEASALRKAFPTQIGGLYTHEEQGAIQSEAGSSPGMPTVIDAPAVQQQPVSQSTVKSRADKMAQKEEQPEPEPEPEPEVPAKVPPPPLSDELQNFGNDILSLPDEMSFAKELNDIVEKYTKQFPDFENEITAVAEWKRNRLQDDEQLF